MAASSAILYTNTAIALAKFLNSSIELYEQGQLTESQLSDIWNSVGVNVDKAESLWKASKEP